MFKIFDDAMNEKASFVTFSEAAECAFHHARQRGECKVRDNNAVLLADFVKRDDGSVSIFATDFGKSFVEGL